MARILKRRRLAGYYPGARAAWIESNGDLAAAENAVRSDPKKYGFDPMTIVAIIQIISMLWQLWRKHKLKNPPSTLSEFEHNYSEINAFEGINFDDQ